MSDLEIIMVHILNILAKVSMKPWFVLQFMLSSLYLSFVLVFCLERWSYNNFPYYEKDPLND